ncbi:MAG: putative 2-aminoethylphosphonate ABC transporter substrate-binding protein [Alphaproteobacteria bacterium]|nr:putative 2-aminoethylphosphonate ABC transporter substrate-binding protein [Alphaproteobacteria bacterium]
MLRRVLTAGAAALALAWSAGADAQQKTRITVYTALESDQLAPYKQAFEADNPDIDIQWVRESTGTITARFLAEKDNPRADAVWGLAVTSIILFDQAGLVQPYTPKGAEALKPQFRSTASPMAWTGMDAWLAVVCVNTVEQKKAGAPMPASWNDLLDPKFKGQIVMPNPASSGTGYLAIAGWMKAMGEKAAWEFMDKLHENVAVYTHSGSAPCVQSARGERMVGLGFDMRGASEKSKGAPIELVIPKEGSGWDMEASAIVKGTKNLAAAQKLMDWTVTQKANQLYGKYYAIVATPGLNVAPPNYPTNAEPSMLPLDLGAMAKDRDRILAEWTKRYDGKSAPR